MLLLKTESTVARQRGEGDLGEITKRLEQVYGKQRDGGWGGWKTQPSILSVFILKLASFFSPSLPSFSSPSTLSVSATALNGPVFTRRHT